MNEREGGGFGAFLLGLGVGAVVGFLFAPQAGEATRGKLQRKLRDLRHVASEKAGELRELLDAADAEEDEPSDSEALRRRLGEAKQRRRAGGAKPPARLAAPDEEEEPVA